MTGKTGQIAFRLLRISFHLLWGMLLLALVFPLIKPRSRSNVIARWARGCLKIFAITLEVRDHRLGIEKGLFVSNHVSWLDICVLQSIHPGRFVAKSEVASWPLVGWMAVKTGTLFIHRKQARDVKRVVGELGNLLKAGESAIIFPEGTTTDGQHLLPFHPSLLQSAIAANSIAYPVAIRYETMNGQLNFNMAYIGTMSLIQSMIRIAAQGRSRVVVTFGTPIRVAKHDRYTLARMLEARVAQILNTSPVSRTLRL